MDIQATSEHEMKFDMFKEIKNFVQNTIFFLPTSPWNFFLTVSGNKVFILSGLIYYFDQAIILYKVEKSVLQKQNRKECAFTIQEKCTK